MANPSGRQRGHVARYTLRELAARLLGKVEVWRNVATRDWCYSLAIYETGDLMGGELLATLLGSRFGGRLAADKAALARWDEAVQRRREVLGATPLPAADGLAHFSYDLDETVLHLHFTSGVARWEYVKMLTERRNLDAC